MPNWCSGTVVFYSKNRDMLVKMRDRFNEIFNGEPAMKNDFGHGWMGDYSKAYFPDLDPLKVECRGSITIEDEVCETLDGYFDFRIYTWTAWGPKIGLWREIAEKFYPDVNIAYIAEEPGYEVYVKWDEVGYFDEKLYVDMCYPTKDGEQEFIEDNYEFDTVDDILKWIDDNLPFEVEHTEDLVELEKRICNKFKEYAEKNDWEEDELYCVLSEFREVPLDKYELMK